MEVEKQLHLKQLRKKYYMTVVILCYLEKILKLNLMILDNL